MYIILISGPPASGKSTFAKYLQNELNALLISKDLIKEILFDTIGFTNRNEKVKLNDASICIINYILENIMKTNSIVLVENNFENDQREDIESLIKKYNYKALNIMFDADTKVLYQRFIMRNNGESRHMGHITNSKFPIVDEREYKANNMSLSEFENAVNNRGFKDFYIPGDIIKVDTTDFDKISYKDILDKVYIIIN